MGQQNPAPGRVTIGNYWQHCFFIGLFYGMFTIYQLVIRISLAHPEYYTIYIVHIYLVGMNIHFSQRLNRARVR